MPRPARLAAGLIMILLPLFSSGTATEGQKNCPLTSVDQYTPGVCDSKGWVQTPVYLSRLTGVGTMQACAGLCYRNPGCKSFRYRQESGRCDLYKRYLEAMNFNAYNYQIGRYSNIDCYSADCNVINACNAVEDCQSACGDRSGYCWTDYSLYACGFGETPKLDRYHPKQISRVLLDGTLNECKAVQKCALVAKYGPFDIYFHIPSEQWVCVLRKEFGYDGGSLGGYIYPEDQHVNRNTLSVKNESVGSSYGYYFSYYYYD